LLFHLRTSLKILILSFHKKFPTETQVGTVEPARLPVPKTESIALNKTPQQTPFGGTLTEQEKDTFSFAPAKDRASLEPPSSGATSENKYVVHQNETETESETEVATGTAATTQTQIKAEATALSARETEDECRQGDLCMERGQRDEAIEWYAKAADETRKKPSVEAQFKLGRIYYEDCFNVETKEVVEKMGKDAKKLLNKASKKKHLEARKLEALCFWDGIGCYEQNTKEAIDLYKQITGVDKREAHAWLQSNCRINNGTDTKRKRRLFVDSFAEPL
jgi:TPR repeat protein